MLFIIEHDHHNEAHTKQMRGLIEVCKTRNGATVYEKPERDDCGQVYYYYNAPDFPDFLRLLAFGHYERDFITAWAQEHDTPTAADELNRIKEAITAGSWTSNGDALFCELMHDSETAAAVRVNRARIYEQREREEQQRREQYAREQQERKEREEQQRRENTEKAENAYKRGEFITAAGFELLAEKYGVKLPARLVAWLRECCGGLRVYRDYHEYCGAWLAVQYKTIKGRKSTTIGDYGAKVAQAMGITAA